MFTDLLIRLFQKHVPLSAVPLNGDDAVPNDAAVLHDEVSEERDDSDVTVDLLSSDSEEEKESKERCSLAFRGIANVTQGHESLASVLMLQLSCILFVMPDTCQVTVSKARSLKGRCCPTTMHQSRKGL